eukprot:UN00267
MNVQLSDIGIENYGLKAFQRRIGRNPLRFLVMILDVYIRPSKSGINSKSVQVNLIYDLVCISFPLAGFLVKSNPRIYHFF